MAKWADVLPTIHSCGCSVISSVLIVLLNKHLLNSVENSSFLNLAIFCTMCHQIFSAVFTRLLIAFGQKNTLPSDRNDYYCASLAFVIGGSIVFNNWAIALLPVSTCQIFKLLCIPVIASTQCLLYGRLLSLRVVGALLLLVVGVGQATDNEVLFQALPSLVACTGLTLTVGSQILLERYNDIYPQMESLDILQVTSSYLAGFLLVIFTILEAIQPSEVLLPTTWSVQNVALSNVTCVLAVATNYYAHQMIQNCSAVTFQLVGNVKSVLIVATAFCFGSSTFTTQQISGLIFALLGSVLYSYSKLREPPGRKSTEYVLAYTLWPQVRTRSTMRLWIGVALVVPVITLIASQSGWVLAGKYKASKIKRSSHIGEDLDAARDRSFKENLSLLHMAVENHLASDVFHATDALNRLSPRNANKFTLNENSIPLLLLVHDRAAYLEVLVEQLRKNYRINETIIIVVHDGVFKPVLDAIEMIDFCQVKQIFTPYSWSIQSEIGDPDNLKVKSNSLKMAWLWAHYQAFEIIRPDASHIAYIEDDFWVLPDYYQTLFEVRDYITTSLKETFGYGFTVGARPPSLQEQRAYDFNLSISYNFMTGFVGSRLFWNELKMAKELYCLHPSQNWDYTLGALWNWGVASRWTLATSARLVHAGFCGGFHFSTDLAHPYCNITGNAELFQNWSVQLDNRTWQFDEKTLSKEVAEQGRSSVGNSFSRDEGLWGKETSATCNSLFKAF